MNAPALLLRWIPSFLRNRTVKVRILGYTSREIAINYGVPQGSPISPLLFLLYLSKLPKLVPNTRRSLFADDFMIYAESSIADSHLIQSNLQTSLDKLTVFNADHRIILRGGIHTHFATRNVIVTFLLKPTHPPRETSSVASETLQILRRLWIPFIPPPPSFWDWDTPPPHSRISFD